MQQAGQGSSLGGFSGFYPEYLMGMSTSTQTGNPGPETGLGRGEWAGSG